MGRKLEESGHGKVLEYVVEEKVHSQRRGWDKILEICSCNWAENMVHYGAWAYIFFIVTGLKIWQKT